MPGAICSVFIVSVHDRFRVAVRVETVPEPFEFFTQLAVVVNLAVVNDPGRCVGIVNWLLPAFKVDNCEAAHGQTHAVVEVIPVLVRTTMTDCVVHPLQQFPVDLSAVAANDACYPTHE
jgi:hypothetical protein